MQTSGTVGPDELAEALAAKSKAVGAENITLGLTCKVISLMDFVTKGLNEITGSHELHLQGDNLGIVPDATGDETKSTVKMDRIYDIESQTRGVISGTNPFRISGRNLTVATLTVTLVEAVPGPTPTKRIVLSPNLL